MEDEDVPGKKDTGLPSYVPGVPKAAGLKTDSPKKNRVIMPKNVIDKAIELECISEVPADEYCEFETEVDSDVINLCNEYQVVAFDDTKKPVLGKSGKGKKYICNDQQWKKMMQFQFALIQRVMSELTIHYDVDFGSKVKGLPTIEAAILRCGKKCGFVTQDEKNPLVISGREAFKNYAMSWIQPYLAGSFYDTMLQLESWLGEFTNSHLDQQKKFAMVKSAIKRSRMTTEESTVAILIFVYVVNMKKWTA